MFDLPGQMEEFHEIWASAVTLSSTKEVAKIIEDVLDDDESINKDMAIINALTNFTEDRRPKTLLEKAEYVADEIVRLSGELAEKSQEQEEIEQELEDEADAKADAEMDN